MCQSESGQEKGVIPDDQGKGARKTPREMKKHREHADSEEKIL